MIDVIRQADGAGIEVLEIRPEVLRRFNDEIQQALGSTVFNSGGCSSYYLDARGRNFAAWPRSTTELRAPLSHFDMESYRQEPARPR